MQGEQRYVEAVSYIDRYENGCRDCGIGVHHLGASLKSARGRWESFYVVIFIMPGCHYGPMCEKPRKRDLNADAR
jgi:hypothetical protein